MPNTHAEDRGPGQTLSSFILLHKADILSRWKDAVRRLPEARGLSEPALLDSMPQLLDAIAATISRHLEPEDDWPRHLVEVHVLDRLNTGCDLDQMVAEYAMLREAILDQRQRAGLPAADPDDDRRLHRAIDQAISQSVNRFTDAQTRTARALDRIATASFESTDLDDLLRRLLTVMVQSIPAVDTAAILLRSGDVLQVRAAVGLERETEIGFTVEVGEGFAGTIAARQRPLLLRSAATDPLVRSPLLRARGVRALYGVPLIENGSVTGVAHIGSLTAHDFSEADRAMLDHLAARATAAISQQVLRHEAERRAVELGQARARAERAEAGHRFLSEATAILTSSLEYEKTLERVTSLAVPQLADWCGVNLVGPDEEPHTVAVAHVDPAKAEAARALAGGHPMRADAPVGAAAVIRTGLAQLGSEVTDEMLASVAHDAEHLRQLKALGLGSYIVVPLSAHGRVFGALTLATVRASGRRYGQAELEIAEHLGRRAGLAIENARLFREAQDAIRLRERVLAIVSHDLRNPLTAARMSAELIAKQAHQQKDERLLKHAETIERSALRMEHLIGDLLDMARIHAGKLEIVRRAHRADAIVREASEPFEGAAARQGIHYTVEPTLTDLSVDCDRERVLQIFSNLLGNAFKFAARGDHITLRARREGGELRFEVADSGPGIPADERPHIFDAYWSAERRGVKGTGLGLYIVRGVVEAHGGRIWVDSDPGRGTTFFFTLPLAQSAPAAGSGQLAESKDPR
ncbi:MAG TPA: ATP-binding protein [Polyangia bacterium]|nr:ATP-binding protein [Polyangia bacterium]